MSGTVAINDADFQAQVVGSDVPVVVDFWAPWCGPCKAIGPVLETLSAEFVDQVKFVKVNVDDNQEHAAKFGVQGIPTLLFFKGGEKVHQVVGALPEAQMREQVKSAFGV